MQDKTPHKAPPRTASQPGPEPWACHLLGLIAHIVLDTRYRPLRQAALARCSRYTGRI